MARSKKTPKSVESFTHDEASRPNIPPAEYQSLLSDEERAPILVAYERRNPDLDPQLVWRGKDLYDWSDLVAPAPPIYIQEKIHPQALIEDLRRQTQQHTEGDGPQQLNLFADFNGLPSEAAKTEFYRHQANWSNRMILGDSLQVMASLAEREGLRGQVQCIYIDPPYGIRFNSNFQWSTTSRDVKDGGSNHITREPEQVKAFRDTWRDGIHSYLTYLRDRLFVAYDLLAESGAIFIQIGAANVHRLRSLMDEIFGEENFVSQISVRKTSTPSSYLDDNQYFILFYAKSFKQLKFRNLYRDKPLNEWITETRGGSWGVTLDHHSRPLEPTERRDPSLIPRHSLVYALTDLQSDGTAKEIIYFEFEGKLYAPRSRSHWKTVVDGLGRLGKAGRLETRGGPPWFRKYYYDTPFKRMTNVWDDTSGKTTERVYVVQTEPMVIQRLLLMCSDVGDIVLDPTCGAGTTAYVAEEWGRRWITIDTSRVALALARARVMGACFPYYILKDSPEGQQKEAELSRSLVSDTPTNGDLRQGFVYERVPHIMLKDIANNAEIDVIWENFQQELEPLRHQLNEVLGTAWEEWEIPRDADKTWPLSAQPIHARWWKLRIERQRQIDASIAANAQYEYLYDKPYEDNKRVRVAGPFTVESISPHRMLGVDENEQIIDPVVKGHARYDEGQNFAHMIIENLRIAGVQQAHKEDKINFTALNPWPGKYVCAEGRYIEGDPETGVERRAAIFIGPEFGTVSRPDLVTAAREAADAGFQVLIACAFNYDAHSTEFERLGAIPVLKARMNADLHMATDLKTTRSGNLFVIFGEPDIEYWRTEDGQLQVEIKGVDVFHPSTGEIRSDGPEGIAMWFIDTDYNEESFFVRHAYFLGANDPYQSLKTTLKAEIDQEAWESLYGATSRPFDIPTTGRFAVKVINHLGDEVMKVFRVN